MIILYTTPPLWGLPSISPACLKLETCLRMAKVPYQRNQDLDLSLAPKGKIPFIEDRGEFIGDSTLILQRLQQHTGIDLDRTLTSEQQAIALAFRRMLKEHTYWGLVYIRYGMEANWQQYRQVMAQMLAPNSPHEIWEPIVEGLRKQFLTQLYQQGLGRHQEGEIDQLITADLQALSTFLADRPYFMGDQPTTLDATVYAHIGNLIQPPFDSAIVNAARNLTNLCQHCDRMTQHFFNTN